MHPDLEKLLHEDCSGVVVRMQRKFGFVKNAQSREFFFHVSEVLGALTVGQEVLFTVSQDSKTGRSCAVRLRPAPPGLTASMHTTSHLLLGQIIDLASIGPGVIRFLENGRPTHVIFRACDVTARPVLGHSTALAQNVCGTCCGGMQAGAFVLFQLEVDVRSADLAKASNSCTQKLASRRAKNVWQCAAGIADEFLTDSCKMQDGSVVGFLVTDDSSSVPVGGTIVELQEQRALLNSLYAVMPSVSL